MALKVDIVETMAGEAPAGEGPGGAAMVRGDSLRNFASVVTRLGGDPRALLAKAGLDPDILGVRQAVLPLQSLLKLVQQGSVELSCPDFGMRLAAMQEGAKVLGPLEVAMRNSRTLREALEYCAAHLNVYSAATGFAFEEDAAKGTTLIHVTFPVPTLVVPPQAMERGILLMHQTLLDFSGGRVRPQEIWMMHDRIAAQPVYESYFGVPVRFGRARYGLLLDTAELASEISDRDPLLYELATSFIDVHYPPDAMDLAMRVSAVVETLLQEGRCTFGAVAATLGMHPRALQRRLKAEGQSFGALMDSVRRAIALRSLRQSDMPLIRVAEMLGYSDSSVLTRSCYRWFAASPRQVRLGKGP